MRDINQRNFVYKQLSYIEQTLKCLDLFILNNFYFYLFFSLHFEYLPNVNSLGNLKFPKLRFSNISELWKVDIMKSHVSLCLSFLSVINSPFKLRTYLSIHLKVNCQ